MSQGLGKRKGYAGMGLSNIFKQHYVMCFVWVIVWVTAEVFTSLVLECKRKQIEHFQASSWWNMPLFINLFTS